MLMLLGGALIAVGIVPVVLLLLQQLYEVVAIVAIWLEERARSC